MTEPCCRAAAINTRQHMRESWLFFKFLVFASLVGMSIAWPVYAAGLINGDWFGVVLYIGMVVITIAPVAAFLLLLALCWADARHWDKEHGKCGDPR